MVLRVRLLRLQQDRLYDERHQRRCYNGTWRTEQSGKPTALRF
jgi:hypothetical protein